VWSGDLDVGQSRTHSIKSVHKKKDGFLYNDLELKMTLTEVSGTVIIKITKVTNNDTEQTIISTQQTTTPHWRMSFTYADASSLIIVTNATHFGLNIEQITIGEFNVF
jgi:hypothetical protein